jgi:hypothetical protein
MGGRNAQSLRQCSEPQAAVFVFCQPAEQPGYGTLGDVAAKEALLCDGMVPKNGISPHIVDVKDPLLCDGDDMDSKCSCDGDVWYCDCIVSSPSLHDGVIEECSLSCDGCRLPIGMQCSEVRKSVLCNLDSVKDPSAEDMGLEQCSVHHEGYEPANCNFCGMNHSLMHEVALTRIGPVADQRSVCDGEHERCCGLCTECEDTSWKEQGRACVTNRDTPCSRRRRRRGVLWWLLLVLLGAAPLVSGQLRPKTDISTSRAEGGKLYMPRGG